jgi:tetratricopeptide (TPR) repeat protein
MINTTYRITYVCFILILLFGCKPNEKEEKITAESTEILLYDGKTDNLDVFEDSVDIVENEENKSAVQLNGEAIQLNSEGMQYYDNGDYRKAIEFFEKSIVRDPAYILPHYNLACTLNILRDSGENILIKDIVSELQITLNLNPVIAGRNKGWAEARIREDDDLKSLLIIEEFQEKVLNYHPLDVNIGIIDMLAGTFWDYGNVVYASFESDYSIVKESVWKVDITLMVHGN